jgi:hypothetical protein
MDAAGPAQRTQALGMTGETIAPGASPSFGGVIPESVPKNGGRDLSVKRATAFASLAAQRAVCAKEIFHHARILLAYKNYE